MSMTDKAADLIAIKTADKYGKSGYCAAVLYAKESDDNLAWTFVRSENLAENDDYMMHYATALVLELQRMFGKDTQKLVKDILKEVKNDAKH